jgi:hypothetical protein
MRNYSGVSGGVEPLMYAHGTVTTQFGNGSTATYPTTLGSRMIYAGITVWDLTLSIGPRGSFPGVYTFSHSNLTTTLHGTFVAGASADSGKDFMLLRFNADTSGAAIDVTGPWR